MPTQIIKMNKKAERERFEFELNPIARKQSGTQKVVLRCPTVRGHAYTGWLTVRWNPRFATVQWDYGSIDGRAYPQCDIFRDCLEEANWDRELICRLIHDGWRWELIDRTSMRWNKLKGVEQMTAQWIIDTLPGVYEKACVRFNELQAGKSVDMI
jgi:hypothetical protein